MAELVDCLIVQDVLETGLTNIQNNIAPNHIKLYIEPDNTQEGLVYAVKASDFEDKTYLLPAEDIAGIASGSGAGGLGITLQDTIPNDPYNLDNKVEIIVDIDDSFTINQDTVIKVDIGGRAMLQTSRDVILALRTDFKYQERGGEFTFFDTSSGENTDLSFAGKEGVGKVTFTPFTAGGVADPLNDDFNGKTTPVPSSSNHNLSNDFNKKDDIIYVRKTVDVGQWTKIGTIKVEIDTDVENTAIGSSLIPSASQGKYGFVHRSPNDAFNSFNEASAISKEMKHSDGGMEYLALACHQLRAKDDQEFETAEAASDSNTGLQSILAGSHYKYSSTASAPWDPTVPEFTVAYVANNKNHLTRTWEREWWFKYPNTSELEEFGNISDGVFWHELADMNSAKFNVNNDLSLSGFLTAAPLLQGGYFINNISLGVDNLWDEMDLENANLIQVENPDGLSDSAWIIPLNGNANGAGDQFLRIQGTEGAKFRAEIQEVDIEDFTTGRSLGDDSVDTFRNLIQWEDSLADPDGDEMGITTVITIPASEEVELYLPQISNNSGSSIKNFYLNIMAESDTVIAQSAIAGRFGADIDGATNAESFSQGLNWTNAPGNTLKIRLRQNPDTFIDLVPNLDNLHSSVALEPNTGDMGGNSITGVQLWKSNHNASGGEQNINFKFCVKGTGGHFEFKDGAYNYSSDSYSGNFINVDALHDESWGSSHPCVNANEEDGVCSLRGINHLNHNVPTLNTQLYTHLYPVLNNEGPNMISGATEHCPNCSSVSGGADWQAWYGDWNHNTNSTSHTISFTSDDTIRILRSSSSNAGATPFTNNRGDFGVYNYSNVLVGETYRWRVYVGTVNNCVGKIELREMDEPGQYGVKVGGNQVMSFPQGDGTYLETGVCTSNDNQWYEGTFTATKPVIKIMLSNTSETVGHYVDFKAVALFKDSAFENHGANTNGDETVTIMSLQAVKGRVTGGVSDYNGTLNGDIAIDNTGGNAHDDYLTVIGTLRVNAFGPQSNVYQMDLSHVAEYIV